MGVETLLERTLHERSEVGVSILKIFMRLLRSIRAVSFQVSIFSLARKSFAFRGCTFSFLAALKMDSAVTFETRSR